MQCNYLNSESTDTPTCTINATKPQPILTGEQNHCVDSDFLECSRLKEKTDNAKCNYFESMDINKDLIEVSDTGKTDATCTANPTIKYKPNLVEVLSYCCCNDFVDCPRFKTRLMIQDDS